MGQIIGEGITFDDVLLVPAYSQVVPNQVDLTTQSHLFLKEKNSYNSNIGRRRVQGTTPYRRVGSS